VGGAGGGAGGGLGARVIICSSNASVPPPHSATAPRAAWNCAIEASNAESSCARSPWVDDNDDNDAMR
jgi:hypothetical protein